MKHEPRNLIFAFQRTTTKCKTLVRWKLAKIHSFSLHKLHTSGTCWVKESSFAIFIYYTVKWNSDLASSGGGGVYTRRSCITWTRAFVSTPWQATGLYIAFSRSKQKRSLTYPSSRVTTTRVPWICQSEQHLLVSKPPSSMFSEDTYLVFV